MEPNAPEMPAPPGMSDHPIALITGAGRGIGRAIALRLSGAGYSVVLVARSSEEITELRNEIMSGVRDPGSGVRNPFIGSRTSDPGPRTTGSRSPDNGPRSPDSGPRAYATPCDITNPEEVAALRDDIERELGPISVLVNNAGIAPSAKFEDTTDTLWREAFAVNVDGAFYMTRAFLPGMIVRRPESEVRSPETGDRSPAPGPRPPDPGPHVISIGSTASLAGFRYTAAYTASKHALLGLMRALAAEFKSSGVKFSTVCPGFTRTQILHEAVQATMTRGHSQAKAEAMFAQLNHSGRLLEPEDVAETVLQLLTTPSIPSGRAYHAGTRSLEFAD